MEETIKLANYYVNKYMIDNITSGNYTLEMNIIYKLIVKAFENDVNHLFRKYNFPSDMPLEMINDIMKEDIPKLKLYSLFLKEDGEIKHYLFTDVGPYTDRFKIAFNHEKFDIYIISSCVKHIKSIIIS